MKGRDSRRAELDTETTAAVTAIAGLRRRLNRPGVLENPAVRSELSKLDEQLSARFSEQGEGNPGRHRSVPTRAYGRPRGRQIADVSGFDLKPDPLSASTPAEFIEVLRRYKVWSGDPSWRAMARQSGQQVVHSTMYSALGKDVLPKFEVMRAIVIGCGGSEDDLRAFATAWRKIEAGLSIGTFLPAPVATLRLVPGG